MKTAIIHLSDIHLVTSESANVVLKRIKQIASAIDSVCIDANHGIVVVSGDTAFSGKESEYKHGSILIREICDAIAPSFPGCPLHILTIPGNHDCDFNLADSVRSIILEAITPDKIDKTIVEQCAIVQKNYFAFEELMGQAATRVPSAITSQLYSQHLINLPGQKIVFHLLNSAWMSQINEKPGRMHFPANLIKAQISSSPPVDLAVAVIHHPFNWYWPDNGRELRLLLENNADLILTGHEHIPSSHAKKTDMGHQNEYLEGGVLQETGKDAVSSFNVVIFDLAQAQQQSHRLVWRDDLYITDNEPLWRPFERNIRLTRGRYDFSSDFTVWLNDPGAGYTHPYKGTLSLSDFFVYPDLMENQRGSGESRTVVKSRDVVDHVLNHAGVQIVADEKAGKTSLAKMLMRDIRDKGCVPILLSGEDLSNCAVDQRLKIKIEEKIAIQYSREHIARFWQLNSGGRAIIIDDFHKIELNRKGKDSLIELISNRFGHIVILAGDEFRLEEIATPTRASPASWNIRRYTMLQFGHALRHELVSKWCRLGRELTDEESIIERRIERAEKRVSAVISNDLIPSLPIYVLILLQRLEGLAKAETVASAIPSGSFGYLYEVLVTASLSRVLRPAVDLDTKYNYLTELAYHMFSSKRRSLSDRDAQIWHDWYRSHYQLNLHFPELWSELDASGTMDRNNGLFTFKYKYIYYFFVARYFRDHIGEGAIQLHIKEMCKSLQQDESANVMLFLCHLSKDDSILRELLSVAKSILPTASSFDINRQSAFFNKLGIAIPELVLEAGDLEANRRRYHESQDEAEGRKGLASETHSAGNGASAPTQDTPQAVWGMAIKTIKILGQVLKNFAGSLTGELKAELVRECYGLGLRLLGDLLHKTEEALPLWGEAIRVYLKTKHEDPTALNIIKAINRLFIQLLQIITTGIVKYISDSVGTEKITQTLSQIVAEDDNSTVKVIDLSVRLDHYSEFPLPQIEDLARLFNQNPFGIGVLQYLVWLRFYMYSVEYKIKQSACETLGIPIKHQRQLFSPGPKKSSDKRKKRRK